MKGCSKKKSRRRLGGGELAYTGETTETHPSSVLAYTVKGGSKLADNILLPADVDVRNPNLPFNPYGGNPALPNTGPEFIGEPTTTTNMGTATYGGCGSCQNIMTGGNNCETCQNIMTGGRFKQKGGKTIDPQGLVGSPWTSSPATWPGVGGVDGNRNYLAYNNYKVDPQTALVSVGANRPFLYGGKKHSMGGKKRSKKRFTKRRQRGGAMSNLLSQDFINLGRQIQYGIGSAYNGLNGYPSPTPVLPWQGQLPRTPNLYTVRGSAL